MHAMPCKGRAHRGRGRWWLVVLAAGAGAALAYYLSRSRRHGGESTPSQLASTGASVPESWTTTTPDVVDPGFAPGQWPGSALPLADGSAPAGFMVKGNASSMLFHTPESPYYRRTKPEAWFRSADDARAAGFKGWNERRQE